MILLIIFMSAQSVTVTPMNSWNECQITRDYIAANAGVSGSYVQCFVPETGKVEVSRK